MALQILQCWNAKEWFWQKQGPSTYQYSCNFEVETIWISLIGLPPRTPMDQPLPSFLLKRKMETYQNCLFQVWNWGYQLRFLVKLVVYKSRCLRMVVLTVLLFVTILFVLNLHLQYRLWLKYCQVSLKRWRCWFFRGGTVTQPVWTLFLFKSICMHPQGSQGVKKSELFVYK